MDSTILQVPMSKSLRDEAEAIVSGMGFSSLQEAVRVFLSQLKAKTINISFQPKPIQLSKKAVGRYNKMIDEVDSGKEKLVSFEDVGQMMKYLRSQ